MRMAAFLVAGFTIVIGVVGVVSPEYGTMVRRAYYATPLAFYTAGAVRLLMGLIVLRAARITRAPKTLRVLGTLMCLQAVVGTVLGPVHARTVMEWETAQGPKTLRAGAAVALVAGVFMAYAVAVRPSHD